MKWFKWEEGRQGSGYFKMKLLEWKFFDLYLLKFPTGTKVPPHTDKVKLKKHYRFNWLLKGKDTFLCPKTLWRKWRFVFFRPDRVLHALNTVQEDTYILSLGWVKKHDPKIAAAAICGYDGQVYSLPPPNRHHNIISFMHYTLGHPRPIKGPQGFVLEDGRFVDRIEGKEIAIRHNQILPGEGYRRQLFSEDMW